MSNQDYKYFCHESSYIDENTQIGEGTKIWHFCHVQSGSVIGRNCSLGQNVYVGSNVKVGNHVKIQNNVSIYSGVELEDYVFCGPSMVFTNDINPRSQYPKGGNYIKTLVKTGATIGANATIICGNSIGAHAMIAAGAVVTSDVPDYALMIGMPAKQVGWVCECGEKLSKDSFCCKKCGVTYDIVDSTLIKQILK
jgi:UDP-2-acetamido-3-amino-2,3-dideoxy-glucuronate N-acetyltransferase